MSASMVATVTVASSSAFKKSVAQPDALSAAEDSESQANLGHSTPQNNPDLGQEGERLKTARPEPSLEQMSATAKERVELFIRHLLIEGGISESEVHMPTVRVDAAVGTSFYRVSTNEIIIRAEHIDSIITYGEEIFHWLRTQMKPQKERASSNPEIPRIERYAVEEFFGFVGRAVISELCQSTALSELSADYCRSKLEDALTRYRADKEYVRESLSTISVSQLEYLRDFAGHVEKFAALSCGEEAVRARDLRRELNGAAGVIEELRAEFGPAMADSVPRADYEKRLRMCEGFLTKATRELGSVYYLEGSRDDHKFKSVVQSLGQLAAQISEVLNEFLAVTDKWYEDLHKRQDNADTHLIGYMAGMRFLQQEGDASGKIFQLLREPTDKVYFKHVFERKEGNPGGSLLSGLVARVRDYLAVRREKSRMAGKLREEVDDAKSGFTSYTEEGRAAKRALERLLATYRGT